MIKLSINHKERKTNVLCFARTLITSSNSADSSHWTGDPAAVQSGACAHHSSSCARYRRSSARSGKGFSTPTLLTVCPEPRPVCGIVRVKLSLRTASRLATSRGCKFGAKRINSKRNYADGHGFRHVKPTELCLTRRSRMNELSLQRATS